jgi:hypothetical protein
MKTRLFSLTISLFLMVFLLLSTSYRVQDVSCTWDGTAGDWTDASKWSCDQVPGEGDFATINDGTVTLTGDISLEGLTFTYGTLTGPGDLTTKILNWDQGTMSGTGTTTVNDFLNITGVGYMTLSDRTLNNAGDATWARAGSLFFNTPETTFNNLEGATFTIQDSLYTVIWGAGTFNNSGTFTKTNSGSSVITAVEFVNFSMGTVNVEKGLLEITNTTASPSSGTYDIDFGAKLHLTEYHLSGNVTTTGTGTIEIEGTVDTTGSFTFPGTILLTSGTFTLNNDATTVSTDIFTFNYGTLTGAGNLTASTINWDGGTMLGTGTTTATNFLNFTGSTDIMFSDRTLNNAGVATWNKTGNLFFNSPTTTLNNLAGATFTVQNSGYTLFWGAGIFNNSGILNLTTGNFNIPTFTQGTGGITNLAIRGTSPINNYCQLNVSNANLSGPLNISFSGGYTPQLGDDFILLTYSSTRTGDFSPVNISPVPNIFWLLYYQEKSLHLLAVEHQIYIPIVTK